MTRIYHGSESPESIRKYNKGKVIARIAFVVLVSVIIYFTYLSVTGK